MPDDVQVTLIRILLAVLVIALIWSLRRIVRWLLYRVVRLVTRRTDTELDSTLLQVVTPPARLLIVVLALFVAARILQLDPTALLFVERLIRTFVIVAVFALAYNLVDVLAQSTRLLMDLTGLTIEDRLLPFIRTAIKLVLVALAVVIVIQEWGYDVAGLIAGLGLGGLAFALAAQDTVANLFGFTTIVGDRPFVQGEFIKTPDLAGTVEHVGLRSTRVRQLDQSIVTIPNSELAQSAILNWSRLVKRRLDFTVTVAYGADPAAVRALLERLRAFVKEQEHAEPDSVQVFFKGFGGVGLDIQIYGFLWIVDWGEFMRRQGEIMLAIAEMLPELGLELAVPSTVLTLEAPQAILTAPPLPEGEKDASRRDV